jgi:hypothetical protein
MRIRIPNFPASLPRRSSITPLLLSLALASAAGCSVFRGPDSSPVIYRNAQYGLEFSLPSSWRGFTAAVEEVSTFNDKPEPVAVITIRHPHWRKNTPWQDIPIVVFTRAQWQAHLNEYLYAGGTVDEIEYNSTYVFAIWSQFNWIDGIKGQ